MAPARQQLSRREQLRLGREIQEQYDHGSSWAAIAVDFDLSKTRVQQLAKLSRKDCDEKARRHQLPLFG
ncbi:hypothetical protein [Nocardia sp. NPDC050406]|uniref:hypothetical protein n=1 Tax=Nocardia sp. NPDC050406 TaxID=3364318 RepID=UPI0037A5AEF1